MAAYIFSTRRKDKKSWKKMEFSLWFGIFTYLAFMYFYLVHHKPGPETLQQNFMALALLLFLLLVYFPVKRNITLQKYASIVIETMRKGLTYKDFQGEKIFSWRDLEGSSIILDTHPAIGVYPREFRLKHSKGSLVIVNDPLMHPLEGAFNLFEELTQKIEPIKVSLAAFRNFCPYCGEAKTGKERICPSCKREAMFINKYLKPFYVIREEIIFTILGALLLGNAFVPIALALFAVFLIIPFMASIKKSYKTINAYLAERKTVVSADTPEEPVKSPGQ
ncbi:MAG: hypothetical protein RDV48_13600 [Candidatus Eremiobacteraeota bacterium]|nr:hypothetical protein [Candidatus Eremiobacteraeota bacterium]